MSKLNINNSIQNFLKNNKIRICAIALLTLIPISLCSCKAKEKTTTNSSIVIEQEDNNLRNHIIKNIDNINVVENQQVGGYYIYEEIYKEIPIYAINENNKKYIKDYEKNFVGYDQYFIQYEEAENLKIHELLKSRKCLTYKNK